MPSHQIRVKQNNCDHKFTEPKITMIEGKKQFSHFECACGKREPK